MILCIRSPLKTVSILSDVYDRELVATIGWAKQVSWPINGDDDIFERRLRWSLLWSLHGISGSWFHRSHTQRPDEAASIKLDRGCTFAQLFSNLTVIPTRFNSFWLYNNTHYYLPTSETKYLQQQNMCNEQWLKWKILAGADPHPRLPVSPQAGQP